MEESLFKKIQTFFGRVLALLRKPKSSGPLPEISQSEHKELENTTPDEIIVTWYTTKIGETREALRKLDKKLKTLFPNASELTRQRRDCSSARGFIRSKSQEASETLSSEYRLLCELSRHDNNYAKYEQQQAVQFQKFMWQQDRLKKEPKPPET